MHKYLGVCETLYRQSHIYIQCTNVVKFLRWSEELEVVFADKTELNPMTQAVISLLSTGPVAPGDKINYTDVELLQK